MAKLSALVVEDEEVVRKLAASGLTNAGFHVAEAADAQAALAALETKAEHVDAVFTDVDMPGSLNGLGLAQRVRKRWPWIKVLITSGRARPIRSELPDATDFLPKPYSLKSMANRLRELIFPRKRSS